MLSIHSPQKNFTSVNKDMNKEYSKIIVSKNNLLFMSILIGKINKHQDTELDNIKIDLDNVQISFTSQPTDTIRILVSDILINSVSNEYYFLVSEILNENDGSSISKNNLLILYSNCKLNTFLYESISTSSYQKYNIFKDFNIGTPRGIWVDSDPI